MGDVVPAELCAEPEQYSLASNTDKLAPAFIVGDWALQLYATPTPFWKYLNSLIRLEMHYYSRASWFL